MLTAVAKLHLLSAAACIVVALVHTYWIHGSRLLGLAESSYPTLVTHISRLDFDPAFRYAADTTKLCLTSTPALLVKTVGAIES
eukprot:3523206-Pleurochrysis_carterae.AAC.1